MARPSIHQATQLAMQGRTRESVQRCRAVLASQPGNVGAARLLGELLRKTGQHEESVRTLRALHRSRPHDARIASELGASLVAGQQAAQAIPLLQRAIGVFPNEPSHRVWLGRAMMQTFRPSGAIAAFQEARRLDPDDTETALLLASAHLSAGQALLARPLLEQLAADEPENAAVQVALAQALEQLSCLEDARAAYRRAGRADHDGLAAAGLVRCLLAEGHIHQAADAALAAHEADPTAHTALALARVHLARRSPDQACAVLEPALEGSARSGPTGIGLWFALGEAREQLGDYPGAFEAFSNGNSLYPAGYSPEREATRHSAWIDSVHPALLAHTERIGADATGVVFIVGMPRSGTTLIEQVLDAHPDAHGCGELATLGALLRTVCEETESAYPDGLADARADRLSRAAAEYVESVRARAPHASCWIDKMPHNFERLGAIDALFPGARVIHCTRHPLDTCLSCFATQLSPRHDYATDLEHLGRAYAGYSRLMHALSDRVSIPLREVRYEEVVSDLEGQARQLVEFAGLPWHDACAEPWNNSRAVSTASVEQVRQPVYTSSVRRFERFRNHIGPLIDVLRAEGVEFA
ncbi:MAG: tetratricopeptide repeat-containing sulfotransferase family protein [Phycisphaerales bacterium JB041]